MGLDVFNYNCPGQLSFIEPDYIKDIDCTKDTLVIRGHEDDPAGAFLGDEEDHVKQ